MEILSYVALVLLTMVGYSSGAAAVTTGRQPVPRLLDVLLACAAVVGAILTRGTLGRLGAIAVWLGGGLVLGALATHPVRGNFPSIDGAVDLEEYRALRRLWERWKVFAARMGNYQGRVILAVFFFTVAVPFALGFRLFSDALRLKGKTPTWHERETQEPSIDKAKNQF